jgi:hypothetical protein
MMTFCDCVPPEDVLWILFKQSFELETHDPPSW